NDLIFVHSSSEYYFSFKIVLSLLEIFCAVLILTSKATKAGIGLALFLILPGLIVSFLNILFYTRLNCPIGYSPDNFFLLFLQKSILGALLVVLFKNLSLIKK